MKQVIIALSILALLSGCASGLFGGGKSESKTTRNTVEVDGDILSVVVDSDDFVDMKKTLATESAREECFKANGTKDGSDIVAVASIVARAAGKGIDCGTSHNDTIIAGINAKVEKHRIWGGVVSGVTGNIPLAGAAYVLGKALDKDTTEINVDGGSTVSGAIGQGNVATEQVSGILTEPAPVNPITLDGESDEEEEVACDVRPLIPIEEGSLQDQNGCFDINQDGLVCSTGGGCEDN